MYVLINVQKNQTRIFVNCIVLYRITDAIKKFKSILTNIPLNLVKVKKIKK